MANSVTAKHEVMFAEKAKSVKGIPEAFVVEYVAKTLDLSAHDFA